MAPAGATAPAGPDGEAGPADLSALFVQRHAELVRLALLMVGDRPTAEDVVQDVFTSLHARQAPTPGERDPLPYLRAAVLNGCRSQLRRRAVARRFTAGHRALPEGRSHESAEQELLRAEERDHVLAALGSLSRRRREVLVLRYYLELAEAEIAQILGISPGTVKSTAARGLAALARGLGEES